MLPLLSKHWRALAVAGAVVLAFASGRFLAPTKTVTRTVDRVVDRVVTKTVQAQATERVRVVYRDRTVVTHADGTVERRNVTELATGTAHVATTSTARETEHAAEHVAIKTVERAANQWRVGALVAVDGLRINQPCYGATLERRLLGPIWVGAFGLSSGVWGLHAAIEF